MVDTNKIKDEFLVECSIVLEFLITEYGFEGPEIDDRYPAYVAVSYQKREIAINCSLDVRDEMISFRILRLIEGKKPNAWKVNEKGRVVAGYLTDLLIHRGVREFMIENLQDSSGLSKRQASFRKVLLSQTRLLKKYGQDILNGSASIFENYSEHVDKS